jgi:hypothetical protein
MELDRRMRMMVSVAVVAVLSGITAYLVMVPLRNEGLGIRTGFAIVILLCFGSMVLVPLWRGHNRWASYEYIVEDEEGEPVSRDLADDITDVVSDIVDAIRDDKE